MDAELQERIFNAADTLYEANGRQTFPTVDAVRRHSKANMNDVTIGMRDWRKAQTVQHSPLLQVPESLQLVAQQLIVKLWQQADATAAETLTAQQAAWQEEREGLSEKLKDRTESNALLIKELERYQKQSRKLEQMAKQQLVEMASLQGELAEKRLQTVELSARLEAMKIQQAELRQEWDAVREENHRLLQDNARLGCQLETAQQEKQQIKAQADQNETRLLEQLTSVRTELTAVQSKAAVDQTHYQETRKTAAQDALQQAERLQALQAERDQLHKELRAAGEEVANLHGRLSVLQETMADRSPKPEA